MTTGTRPTGRLAVVVDRIVCGLAWAMQATAAATYTAVIIQPVAWRSILAADTFSAFCLWAFAVGMAGLWGIGLWEEQRNFYDRRSQRLYRKSSRLGHLGVLLVAAIAAASQPGRVGIWIILAMSGFYASIIWAAWMRTRFLPPEDQAVIDAIHDREAQQAAAAYDASEKEQRRQRLTAIVSSLGYQLTDTPAGQSGKRADEQAHSWSVPTGKHAPLVYFISNGNRIKIGTSTELKRRIRTLALRAENVALLIDGDRRLERQLHQQFADLRIGDTEWFAYESPLTEFITDQNRARKEQAK
ncbi:GIY-YIG nuclease family protein [Streptomyces scabiei]|uniref:GIY-YIG nuclease family protein n=1 Tax=Streptomyces scabiei TaxID=1930 RepID=UPI0029B21915|nr:GIY-YIG nuclease family protein [Streptomyces scabiei]MDX3174200.1 GIY-YIG nuclease family protein [Streptomyces scabiei]